MKIPLVISLATTGLAFACDAVAQATIHVPGGAVAPSSTNHVGIGQRNPTVALDVAGGLALTSHIEMANGRHIFGRTPSGDEKAMIGSSGSHHVENGDGPGWGALVFYPGGPEALRIPQNGNIGLVTVSPS